MIKVLMLNCVDIRPNNSAEGSAQQMQVFQPLRAKFPAAPSAQSEIYSPREREMRECDLHQRMKVCS